MNDFLNSISALRDRALGGIRSVGSGVKSAWDASNARGMAELNAERERNARMMADNGINPEDVRRDLADESMPSYTLGQAAQRAMGKIRPAVAPALRAMDRGIDVATDMPQVLGDGLEDFARKISALRTGNANATTRPPSRGGRRAPKREMRPMKRLEKKEVRVRVPAEGAKPKVQVRMKRGVRRGRDRKSR